MNFTDPIGEINATKDAATYAFFWGPRCRDRCGITLRESQCNSLEEFFSGKAPEIIKIRHSLRYLGDVGKISAGTASAEATPVSRLQRSALSGTSAVNIYSCLDLLRRRGLLTEHRIIGIVGKGWPWNRKFSVLVIGPNTERISISGDGRRYGDLPTIEGDLT